MTCITLIAAYAHHRVIGNKNNQMPWHLPEDLAYFKRTTLDAPIIMGRRTWESLGKSLPNRRNIVISHNRELHLTDAEIYPALEIALETCQKAKETFIIGGAQIYKQAILFAHRLLITEIDQTFDGNIFFPEIDLQQWQEITRKRYQAQSPNNFFFSFVEYRHISSSIKRD